MRSRLLFVLTIAAIAAATPSVISPIAQASTQFTLCDGDVLDSPQYEVTLAVRGGVSCYNGARVARAYFKHCTAGRGPRSCTVLNYRCTPNSRRGTTRCTRGKRDLAFNLLD